MKPDIVSYGTNIIACAHNRNHSAYSVKSGTSMSTPIASGAIALLIQKYPNINNKQVKVKLKNTATDLGFPHHRQGWGQLDIQRLLK